MRDMENSSTTSKITLPKKLLFFGVYFLILAVFAIITPEIILRLKGFQPWRAGDPALIKVNPGGKLYVKNPTLGFANIPGELTVTLSDGYSFKVTNLPNTHRITHPLSTYGEAGKKEEIWIFGCSLTYGWSLNDQETFPWLLQERFPEYEVVNFGVDAYSTVQSLLQFRQALESGRLPKMVVLAFASWHDERNIFSRNWQKAIGPYNKLGQLDYPYARLDQNGNLNYYRGKVEFHEFPLTRYSAFIYFIEQKYNKIEERYHHIREVTKALLMEFAITGQEHKIPVIIAGITQSKGTREMLSFIQENGFKTVDISVDLNIKENIDYPHDGHPNAKANKQYADKLEAFLRDGVLE